MLSNCLPGLCCLVIFVTIADSCSIQSTKKYVSRGSSVDMTVNVKLPGLRRLVGYYVKLASENRSIISVYYYGSAVIGSNFAKIAFTGNFGTGNLSYTIQSMNDSFIGDHEVRRRYGAVLLNCTTLYILVLEETDTFTYTCVSTAVPSGKILNMTWHHQILIADYECPSHSVQENDSLKTIVGGVEAAVIAVIIVAVVVLVLQRRRCNSEMANSPDIGSNICNPRGLRNPEETRQSDGTFRNDAFEDDEPVYIGVEDTSYVNENRPTYENFLGQIPNPATYETIATYSNIQTGEMYESLGDSHEQSTNYDSLTAPVENATHGPMPGQYENL